MATATRTDELKRVVQAPPEVVFDAWLNPRSAGTPWNGSEPLILNPKSGSLYYMRAGGRPHFGRFIKVERPTRIQHTWMSQNTLGEESLLTLTFGRRGKGTLMTLRHSGLPDEEQTKMHEDVWNYLRKTYVRKNKSWTDWMAKMIPG